jgi:hypothetical protein
MACVRQNSLIHVKIQQLHGVRCVYLALYGIGYRTIPGFANDSSSERCADGHPSNGRERRPDPWGQETRDRQPRLWSGEFLATQKVVC